MVVRQKTKGGPLTVELDWESYQGQIHLLVRASLDDWKKLLSVKDTVRPWILDSILDEAKAKVETSARNLPRGLSREEFNFVQKMKSIGPFVHDIIKSFPDFYKKLVEKFEEEKGPLLKGPRGKKGKPKVNELTAFVLDKIFAKEKIKYSIRRDWAENPDNFRRTYLDWVRVEKDFDEFFFALQLGTVCDEFKRYIGRSKHPLEVFELFFKEKSYLMDKNYLKPTHK